MIDLKQMNGVMNTDLANDILPPFHHKYLLNGRFRGNGNNMRVENIPGNVLIPNYLLPSGNNECIGGFYDSVKRRIIWFNYNSNGRNGIYKYDVGTKVLSKIFLCFTDTATDILSFSLDYPVNSASIVYRTESDGDLMYWTDGLNRPRYLNLDTVAALQPFTEDMINAAKDAPLSPLACSYQNDINVNVNNLRKKLFRFAQRWVYKNLEKSTLSTISKVPIPVNGYDPDTDNDSTLNNNILVRIYGGGDDYQSIELLVQVNNGNTWGDFATVATFDRDEYSIPPNGTYDFNFYNDSDYVPIDTLDMVLYYDRVPDVAQALEVLNGNHIIYGNTTDGYNSLVRSDFDVTVTSGLSNPSIPSISAFYTGLSYIIVNIGPIITTGVTYHIAFDYVSGGVPGSFSFNYVTPPGATLTSIATAMAAGVTSGIINGIYGSPGIFQVDVLGVGVVITNVVANTNGTGIENAAPSYKWSCPQRLGLQYVDQWDKPVGGVYSFVSASTVDTTDFAVTTPDFAVTGNVPQVPFIAATINHTPPEGAVSYYWVRAELTPKFIYWITNDYQDQSDGYLYVCIQNLYYQNTQNTGFVPTYDFAKGDRVRIAASFDTGTGFYTPYSLQLDFEILGTVQRTMTSPASIGTFLKLTKPTTFPSAPYQAKMLVDIYTPKSNTPSDLLVFKEWGEKYDIYDVPTQTITYTIAFGTFIVGETIIEAFTNVTATVLSVTPTQLVVDNLSGTLITGVTFTGLGSGAAGTVTALSAVTDARYHMGQFGNQTATQPAVFQWYDGDVYYKNRTFYINVNSSTLGNAFMMDANYNDYFPSEVNSNGRGWVINAEARVINNSVEIRWGGGYLQDTNINQLNRFRPENTDVLDLAKGAILRVLAEGRVVYFYHSRAVGSVGIYSRYIQNNQNQQELISTDELITKNNIYYLKGRYGLQNQASAIFRGDGGVHYFIDCTNGDILRRSGDGIDNVGQLYWGQYFFSDIITPYNSAYIRSNGSRSKILGFYDSFESEAHFILQGGTFGGNTIPDYNFSFNEKRNGFTGFYSYQPEWALQAASLTYSWKKGELYIHNDEIKRNNFYNHQYGTSITLVFNKDVAIKKTLETLAYQGNQYWLAPAAGDILTSQPDAQTGLPQISKLNLTDDFDIQEGLYYAAFKRDMNSLPNPQLALYEGSFLKGVWIEAKLSFNGSDYAYLFLPSVKYEVSQRNF